MTKIYYKIIYSLGNYLENIGYLLIQYSTNTKEKECYIYGKRIER